MESYKRTLSLLQAARELLDKQTMNKGFRRIASELVDMAALEIEGLGGDHAINKTIDKGVKHEILEFREIRMKTKNAAMSEKILDHIITKLTDIVQDYVDLISGNLYDLVHDALKFLESGLRPEEVLPNIPENAVEYDWDTLVEYVRLAIKLVK